MPNTEYSRLAKAAARDFINELHLWKKNLVDIFYPQYLTFDRVFARTLPQNVLSYAATCQINGNPSPD